MRTKGEGPIMMLKEGWISMGDFVRTARKMLVCSPRRTYVVAWGRNNTISNQLSNEHSNLYCGQNVANPCYFSGKPPFLLSPLSHRTASIQWIPPFRVSVIPCRTALHFRVIRLRLQWDSVLVNKRVRVMRILSPPRGAVITRVAEVLLRWLAGGWILRVSVIVKGRGGR